MSKKLSKTLNSALSALSTGLQSGRKNNLNVQRRVRRNRPRRRWRYIPPDFVRSIPSAYVKTPVARFSTRAVDNGIIVNGADLVQEIPSTISPLKESIFAIITSNPLYWIGTRLSSIANMYQNYRPLRFNVHYIPQVAVTQPGTVIMGTLWDNTSSQGNLQKTLITSNGGLSCPCYSSASTNVRLATNLSMNLYRVHEAGTYDSNPFNFVAMMAGGTVVPGYFFVTYSYIFKNAMGSSWTANTYSTTLGDLPIRNSDGKNTPKYKIGQNTAVITKEGRKTSTGKEAPAGTTYAVEAITAAAGGAVGGTVGWELKDNGSPTDLPSDTPVKLIETSPGKAQEDSKLSFTMVLQMANKVPNTTGPTSILPADIFSYVNWLGFGTLVDPKLLSSDSTFVYGRPALVGDYSRQINFEVEFGKCTFAVIFPVKAGGSAKAADDTTYSSTFESDTLVCLTSHRAENSTWGSIGSAVIPANQVGFPFLLVSDVIADDAKSNLWVSFGTSNETSRFANLTSTNSTLRTIDLVDYDLTSALSSLMPQEIIDFKTGTRCPWVRISVSPYVSTTSFSLSRTEASDSGAASSSDS